VNDSASKCISYKSEYSQLLEDQLKAGLVSREHDVEEDLHTIPFNPDSQFIREPHCGLVRLGSCKLVDRTDSKWMVTSVSRCIET